MRAQCDRISALPPSTIETILCLLPLKEAGRTSILSKSWRYSWTKIPKLVFNEDIFKISPSKIDQLLNPEKCEFLNVVCEVLSSHHGPIHEFTLIMYGPDSEDELEDELHDDIGVYDEFDQIVAHLLRYKTVKKLRLDYPRRLPVYVHLLDQLKYLHLSDCVFDHLPTFRGFGSLTSLYLDEVKIRNKVLMHILSSNPLLKSVKLNLPCISNDISTVVQLFKCLPVVEDITVCNFGFKHSARDGASRVLPNQLVHLKYFCIEGMYFENYDELRFLVLMLRHSPSLERLKLVVDSYDRFDVTYNWEKYSDIWLDRLVDLEIRDFRGSKPQLELVKLIMAKSPVLEKVRIFRPSSVAIDKEMKMLKSLLRYRRASPLVEVIFD